MEKRDDNTNVNAIAENIKQKNEKMEHENLLDLTTNRQELTQ